MFQSVIDRLRGKKKPRANPIGPECFTVAKRRGAAPEVEDFGGYETRNESTLRLITDAIGRHGIESFDRIRVNTSDFPATDGKTLSYSTETGNFDLCCPDYVYDHWRQVALDDYETTCNRLLAIEEPPRTGKLGWRGAETNAVRRTLIDSYGGSPLFDVEMVQWDRSDPDNLSAPNFLSIEEQARRWRFILDLEGYGYSARLKLLFFAPRAIFLQDRPGKDLCFETIRPWVHYVPVEADLSDLEEKTRYLAARPDIEQAIIAAAQANARANLTRDNAINRWAAILMRGSR